MTRFSIIIPVYNAQNYIGKCLDSLCNQTFKDFNVIFINDGSKDNSSIVIEEYCKSHDFQNYRLINQENRGAGETRNKGMSLSDGEYTVFLDSDDYVDSDYLEMVNEKIENENSDVIFVDLVRETIDGEKIADEKMSDFCSLSKDELIRAQLTGLFPWGGVRKVAKTSIIQENNLRYAPIKVGEESIYSFRLLDAAKTISFQPKAIYHYVSNENSLTSHDTVDNSMIVFKHILKSLTELGKVDEYITTIRALAITTVVITLNVLNLSNDRDKYQKAKNILNKLQVYIDGWVDYKSMDKRTKLCAPFVKLGLIRPIFFASDLQRYLRKIL